MVEGTTGRFRYLRGLEILLAIGVLVSTWLEVGSGLAAYPRWLYLGGITVPTLVVMPTALALAILGELLVVRRRDEILSASQLGLGILSLFTIFTAAYAVVHFTPSAPDLSVTGVPPLLAGSLLAIGELLAQGLALVARRTQNEH